VNYPLETFQKDLLAAYNVGQA